MSSDTALLTTEEREMLEGTVLVPHMLEDQYEDLEQQHHTSAFGMWVFLATEVMFFGTLFLGLGVYRHLYAEAFEAASVKLEWPIGGINTVVLLISSGAIVLAVHYSRVGNRRRAVLCLAVTALLGVCFLCLKGLEYYLDYREYLIPGWRFRPEEWLREGLTRQQVAQVNLFLLFYWVMTGLHALHVTIGIVAVLVMLVLAWKGYFSPAYYAPVDVTALYWHFVDIVWIFLFPMLYLLGTHHWGS